MTNIKLNGLTGLIVAAFLAVAVLPAFAETDFSKPEELVTRAKGTFEDFVADPDMAWFRDNLKYAKALMIVPRILKGGFVIGGSGGSGVLTALDLKTGDWSNPAFYTMGSVSFGLQIGGAADQVLLLIMTEKALDSYLSGSFKLGVDVSVAAGPVGAGVGASGVPADIYAYHRSKGVFGGMKIDGAIIKVRSDWNESYYGKFMRPTDILIRRTADNPHAMDLRIALSRSTRGTKQKSASQAGNGVYHRVEKGETLYRISKQYGVSVEELRRLNNIGTDNTIHPGQRLMVSPK